MTKLTAKEQQAQKLIIEQVEKTLMLLQNHLQTFCDNQAVGSVPMNYIRTSITLLMEGFKKGATQDDQSQDAVRQG